jgi:hypothetical protein
MYLPFLGSFFFYPVVTTNLRNSIVLVADAATVKLAIPNVVLFINNKGEYKKGGIEIPPE